MLHMETTTAIKMIDCHMAAIRGELPLHPAVMRHRRLGIVDGLLIADVIDQVTRNQLVDHYEGPDPIALGWTTLEELYEIEAEHTPLIGSPSRQAIGGREITHEEAISGLGDPSTWDAESQKIKEEFNAPPQQQEGA